MGIMDGITANSGNDAARGGNDNGNGTAHEGPCTRAWRAADVPFRPFHPFAPVGERAIWQALPRELTDLYLHRAAEHRERPWPRLLAHDWSRFFHDGDRSAYESRYGERRRRVADDLMAYGVACSSDRSDDCAPDHGLGHAPGDARSRALLDDAIDGIMLICDEAAWQLPAHNTYVRDAPQLPWPDPDRPILDLFACETGQLLAASVYLLGNDLPEAIRRRITGKLRHRIVTPYLTDRFWWMGGVDGPTNNWTVWCTQNVLATAFLAPFEPDLRRKVADRAVRSLDAFLADYGEDGCCEEGAGYYHSAGLCLFGALRILADVRPDAFDSLWRVPKIRNIATYIMRMRIRENLYFNFSDCSVHAGLMGAREFLFAQAVGEPAMAHAAATEWRHAMDRGSSTTATPADGMDRINALYLLWEAEAVRTMLKQTDEPEGDRTAGIDERTETFFPSTGIAVMRGGGFDVAVKAGRNGASHSHNDTGNVIVYANGRPVLVDAGVGTYTRQTFSPQRYELWPMQSSWHNLPDFDGVMQRETPDCRAEDVQVSLGGKASRVTADLTHAWPAAAGLRSYRRTVTLDRAAGTLTIEDMADGNFACATMHLMTAEEPLRVADGDGTGNRCGRDGHTGSDISAAFRIGASLLVIDRSGDAQNTASGARSGTNGTDGTSGPGDSVGLGGITVEAKPLDDAKLRGEWTSDRLWRITIPLRGRLRVTVR